MFSSGRAVAHLVGQLATIQEVRGSIPSPAPTQILHFRAYREIGGSADSIPALISSGIFLSRVQAPPPAPRPDRGPKRLRSPC
ncbi:hypothetical protein PoB_004185000 [Plakobranchus ocellatus]|uniref:Uncharacterized protein n=1 Tax=Plakobranchus ocellatus TaxID=259542 RepID=A0AAV4B8E4_9GAST|nr:hypothetical protein PoB_004185000 [Plakobranchus ocellatus]